MAFAAKYPGTCVTCGAPIQVGEMIESALGRGYTHYGHDMARVAAGVTMRKSEPAKPRGVDKVPDGTVGTCERCTAVAIVYSFKVKGKQTRIQVCTKCHTSMVTPLRW